MPDPVKESVFDVECVREKVDVVLADCVMEALSVTEGVPVEVFDTDNDEDFEEDVLQV